MSFVLSLAAAAALQAASPAQLHTYEGLALAPGGQRFAAVEGQETVGAASDRHTTVVVRSAKGAVVGTFDPCPACRYAGPAWSASGQALAFIGSGAQAGTATLFVVEGDKTRVAAIIKGVASKPRWAPDGQSIALLATVGARKETGATQAGARQVGEIGASDVTDEQRIAVVAATGGDLK